MIRLEDLRPNASVRGLLPDCLATVVSVQWFGTEALELTYKTPDGNVANQLLYRDDEPRLDIIEKGSEGPLGCGCCGDTAPSKDPIAVDGVPR